MCKSFAPHSRQITKPVPHHSIFLRAKCSSWCPTNSVKAVGDKLLVLIMWRSIRAWYCSSFLSPVVDIPQSLMLPVRLWAYGYLLSCRSLHRSLTSTHYWGLSFAWVAVKYEDVRACFSVLIGLDTDVTTAVATRPNKHCAELNNPVKQPIIAPKCWIGWMLSGI